MAEIVLTRSAEADLRESASFTARTWGVEQARRYGTALQRCLDDLAERAARVAIPEHPDVRAIRCERHVIFFRSRRSRTEVLAVLHGPMDLVARLRRRLEP